MSVRDHEPAPSTSATMGYKPPRSHLWPFASLSLVGILVGLVFAWFLHRRRR